MNFIEKAYRREVENRVARDHPSENARSVGEKCEQRTGKGNGDNPRQDDEAGDIEPHDFQGIDFLVELHAADFGGEGGARTAGDEHRRQQGSHLASHRDADHVGDIDDGAQAFHAEGPLEDHDHPHQGTEGSHQGDGLCADEL